MRRSPFPTLLFAPLLALLALLLPVAAMAATPTPAPVEGRDYALIEGGAPWQPFSGQIEVAEVFSYACHHCANFQPMVEAWKRKQAKDVELVYVPLPYGRNDGFALGFFATAGHTQFDRVHGRLFRAVHDEQLLPRNPSIDEMASWYGQQGLDAARLRTAMADPALFNRLQAAHQFAHRSGVEGTPTLVIDGRYRVLGRSFEEILRNADAVVAKIRAERRATASD